MNRTNICKNIVQSIKDYITDQVKLEPHRVEKHFVRRRKLSLFHFRINFIIFYKHLNLKQIVIILSNPDQRIFIISTFKI